MDENLGQDLEVSHAVLNYLRACYQGHFASLNMLSQLGFHTFDPDELTECQDKLSYVGRLLRQLGQGIPLFSLTWKGPQTRDAKEVLSITSKMKGDLLVVAAHLEKLLVQEQPFQSPEDTKYAIAAYARFAYTNENYIQGYIAFGESFTLPDLVKSYTAILPQAEKNIEAAHFFFDTYTSEEGVPGVFYRGLFEESLFLPGIFRTHAHDLGRFAALYRGPYSYAHTDIPPQFAEEWAVINVDPNTAGYWNAYSFSARDMVDWVQVGISVPRTAWFWRCLHFTPEAAGGWLRQGFSPPLARDWLDAGFSPEEAIDHIRRGFTNAQTAREESKKIIDE